MVLGGMLDKNYVKSKNHGRAQRKQVAMIHAAQIESCSG